MDMSPPSKILLDQLGCRRGRVVERMRLRVCVPAHFATPLRAVTTVCITTITPSSAPRPSTETAQLVRSRCSMQRHCPWRMTDVFLD